MLHNIPRTWQNGCRVTINDLNIVVEVCFGGLMVRTIYEREVPEKEGSQQLKNSDRRQKTTLPENDGEKKAATLWPPKWSR